jgi:Integrase core domain.
VLDDFSRECLAIEVDTNLPAARILRVLDRIVAWRGLPAKLRMDNGPELISVLLADWAEKNGVALEFIQPGKPTQNSYIERSTRPTGKRSWTSTCSNPHGSEGNYGELAEAVQRGAAP